MVRKANTRRRECMVLRAWCWNADPGRREGLLPSLALGYRLTPLQGSQDEAAASLPLHFLKNVQFLVPNSVAVGRLRLDIFPVFRLAEGLPGLRCLPRCVQPGVSLMERPHSVRSVCLTQPLGAQASRLPGRGQRAALVACGHGCRRGRLRSQGGFAPQKMSNLQCPTA